MNAAIRSRITEETQAKADILIEALPYLKQFGGKRILVKVGGELLDNSAAAASFAQDLVLLKSVGIDVVLVHGGGPQISRMMEKVGKVAEFKHGHRVTDAESIEIASMVLIGSLNTKLVGMLNAHGPKAIGLSGADGRLLLVEPRDPELGFVGNIAAASPDTITHVLEAGYMPVIAPIGIDTQGTLYNINADVAASRLAVAIGAEKFVILSNVPGLYKSFGCEDSLISDVQTSQLKDMLGTGAITAGMIPKIEAVLYALENQVPQAHLLDGRVEHAVLLEVFTPEGIGTMVTKSA